MEFLDQRQQVGALHAVDLVQHQRRLLALAFLQPRHDGAGIAGAERIGICGKIGRIHHQQDGIGVFGARPGGPHHGAIQTAAGPENSRRVHEHDLGLAGHRHAFHRHARGLNFGAHNRDLGANQGIGERGLAGIGRADDGAETAMCCHGTTRASSFAAASCSASRLEPPWPVCGTSPSTDASIVKCGAWAGPDAGHFAIGRRRQAAALRPFLQSRLGVAHFRPLARIVEHLGPVTLDEGTGRRHSAIEIERGDHRFADVAEDRGPGPGAVETGARQLDIGRKVHRFRDAGAGLGAHQSVKPHGQGALALAGIDARAGFRPRSGPAPDRPEIPAAHSKASSVALAWVSARFRSSGSEKRWPSFSSRGPRSRKALSGSASEDAM